MNFFINKFYCKSKRVHCRGVSRISSWEGGAANIFGVFRVKNHDFTPINHIFSNVRGGEYEEHQ